MFSLLFAAGEPASAVSEVHYVINRLKASRIARYEIFPSGAKRAYYLLKNESGGHYLIFEENPSAPPIAELQQIRDAVGKKNVSCRLELQCKDNAFCTGNCSLRYYEMSNAHSGSQCSIRSLSCAKSAAGEAQ